MHQVIDHSPSSGFPMLVCCSSSRSWPRSACVAANIRLLFGVFCHCSSTIPMTCCDRLGFYESLCADASGNAQAVAHRNTSTLATPVSETVAALLPRRNGQKGTFGGAFIVFLVP